LDIDQKVAVNLSGFEASMGKWRKSGDVMAKYLEAMSSKAKNEVKPKVYTKEEATKLITSGLGKEGEAAERKAEAAKLIKGEDWRKATKEGKLKVVRMFIKVGGEGLGREEWEWLDRSM